MWVREQQWQKQASLGNELKLCKKKTEKQKKEGSRKKCWLGKCDWRSDFHLGLLLLLCSNKTEIKSATREVRPRPTTSWKSLSLQFVNSRCRWNFSMLMRESERASWRDLSSIGKLCTLAAQRKTKLAEFRNFFGAAARWSVLLCWSDQWMKAENTEECHILQRFVKLIQPIHLSAHVEPLPFPILPMAVVCSKFDRSTTSLTKQTALTP